MLEKTVYVANDGKIFNNKNDCYIYERSLSVNGAIRVIKSLCNEFCCEQCPFYKSPETSESKVCMFVENKPLFWKEI